MITNFNFNQILEYSKTKSISNLNIEGYNNNNNKIWLIDVRRNDEVLNTGLIPNSTHIELSLIPENLSKYEILKDDLLIFTCQGGVRALKAAEIAQSVGFQNSGYYGGSWKEWESKNEDLSETD